MWRAGSGGWLGGVACLRRRPGTLLGLHRRQCCRPFGKESRFSAVRTSEPSVWVLGGLHEREVTPQTTAERKGVREYFQTYGSKASYVPPRALDYELPDKGVPEVAFAGRSNVGKSSLLSAVLQAPKSLVRISRTPGCTSSLNFFAVGPHAPAQPKFYFVDLPGYGYARVSKKDQERWSRFMSDYLQSRGFLTLRRVLVLIDARRGATTLDWELMEFLSLHAVAFQVVFTKADLVSDKEQAARVLQVMAEFRKWKLRPSHMPWIHVVSAHTKAGIDVLRWDLLRSADVAVKP